MIAVRLLVGTLFALVSFAPHRALAGRSAAEQQDSVRARRLRWAALDQQAELNLDSALVLLQAARRADASYVTAHVEYMYLRLLRFEDAALRRESAALARSPVLRDRCLGIAMAGIVENRLALRDLLALERASPHAACPVTYLALEQPQRDLPDSLRLVLTRRALRESPELWVLWIAYADLVRRRGDSTEAARVIEQGLRAVQHPLYRIQLTMDRIGRRLQQGDTSGARGLRDALRAAMDRDGRVGLRAHYDVGICLPTVLKDQEREQRSAVDRSRVKGDWAWAERTLTDCAREYNNRGDPRRALEFIGRAMLLADSVRLPDLHLALYLLRGRAHSMLGRHAQAARDLRRALELGAGAGRLYNVADAHHNLAHAYEGEGRWADASREIDRFVTLARPLYGGLLFTALIDAGEIRWKAGWHASARPAFEEMVRVVDEERREYYWAGEYYERTGDLQGARRYYEKARAEYGWNSRGQSGLARVYEQLGQMDSAEAVARVHDAQEVLWPPLELPLMPPFLMRRGKTSEAMRVASDWAATQEQRGNAHGADLANVELARLALDARATNVALRAAGRAESLATVLHLPSERVRALTLRGRALRQRGSLDSAIITLRSAARQASGDSTRDNRGEANLALGDALAERGDLALALLAYEVAARAVEHVTAGFSVDVDRARYRDRHLLPFDGAVRALLRSEASAARVAQLVGWSARRKAAALALATHEATRGADAPSSPPVLVDLQARLASSDALLDYIVLDSLVAAIVITRDRASVVTLPVSSDSLRRMVEALRRPLIITTGGRLDMARAPYSLEIAKALHDVLVRPLASALEGARKLLVVPDGALHALPFEALVTAAPPSRNDRQDYAGATYLLDAYEIEYLPSSVFLPRTATGSLSASSLLVLSYGAPGADREAAALRAEWPRGNVTVLQGARATEIAAKAGMARYGIIHFAVHARASARDPLASHLRLAPDSVEDSYLNLSEVTAARSRARLVVLSACETDAGPIFNGEGVMGLARAFLASGAHAVVGTQWPIGANAADVMAAFYSRLAGGEAPAAALRGAKLAQRSRRETAHPFYWAGAILVTGGSDSRSGSHARR